MTVRRTTTFLVALPLLLLPACAGGGSPAPSVDAAPETVATGEPELPHPEDLSAPGILAATSDASEAMGAVTVTLLDPGEEPRRELRYDFGSAPSATVTGLLTATFGVSGDSNTGEPLPQRAPLTIAAPTEAAVLEVDEAGTATVAFGFGPGRVVDASERDGRLAAVERTIEALADVRMTYSIDDRGFASPSGHDGSVGEAPGPGPELGAIAGRLAAFVQPLPAEPVGPGAVWTVTSTTDLGGVLVRHTISVELLERDGDLIELLFMVEDVATTGAFDVPGADGLEATEIRALSLDGGGNVTARLDRPLPLVASKGLTADLLVGAPGSDRRSSIARTIVSDASLESDT